MSPPANPIRQLLSHPALAESENRGFLGEEIARCPDPEGGALSLLRFAEKNGFPGDRQQILALVTLAGQSPFLFDLLLQHPQYLPWAAGELGRSERRTPEDLREELARFRFTLSTLPDAAALRRFKHREHLRIALRDLLGRQDLAGTTQELSLLADVLVQEAFLLSHREVVKRHGPPQYLDDQGRLCEATFAVLSLGKLGGEELNYSSDIDLVYVYSREGRTAGGAGGEGTAVSNKELFTRLGEGINRRLSGISREGQVFRVDLNLRPGGRDGELVSSRRAILAYYRTWARNWERQALVKARHTAGDRELGEGILRDLQRSIFRSSGGPLAALEIKEMKDRIDKKLSRSGRTELDIKLGTGGLRELEFAVQALQIGHGAGEPWLREGNTLRALHRLADKEFLSYGEHSALSRAYLYLRKVEHRLQMERNRQTDLLPSTPEGLRQLARRLGYLREDQEASEFLEELDRHRTAIRAFYDSVFGRLAQRSLESEERDLLLDALPDGELRALLASAGAAVPEESARHLARLRRLFSPDRVRPGDRREMRRVSATIVAEAVASPAPERAFMNLERFLSSLLVEKEAPRLLRDRAEWIPALMRLFGKSQALSQMLIRRPAVLEEMGSAPDFFRQRGGQALDERLRARLQAAGGVRDAASILRRFHQLEVLLIGFRDVHRQDNLSRTLRYLTDLAQACVAQGEEAAAGFSGAGGLSRPRFAVLGLGRLGYQELDYNSDLDLVFVAEDPSGGGGLEAVRKRAETLIHLLTAVTQEGSLYSVDLRLRPAGREGELIQTREGIQDYFRSRAETWEKLAFLKARPVAGDIELGEQVLSSIRGEIFRGTDVAILAREVREMKERLEQAVGGKAAGEVPLKLGSGGLMEIHFLIEFLQIRHHLPGPEERDTLRMLTHLQEKGLIPTEDYTRLYSGYLLLRSLDHAMRLLYDRPGDRIPLSTPVLSRLAAEVSLSREPSRDARQEALLGLLRETRESIHSIFLRLVA